MSKRERSHGSMDSVRDAERTRAEIIDVATSMFARNGYSGARVDEIAQRTRTTKRMIYYYFGSKSGLYTAVLECAYAGIREHERQLELGHLSPTEAVRRLVELTFDYDSRHPEFIRLVAVENIHDAEFLAKSNVVGPANSTIVELLEKLLVAGREAGEFTADVSALELHLMISAMCFFHVSNQPSIKALFGVDMATRSGRLRQIVADIVLSYLTAPK